MPEEVAMTIMLQDREVLMRSTDADWTYELWEQLPHDEYRYEVIAGVLYMSTAPSPDHQRIDRNVFLALHEQIDRRGLGETFFSPIGLVIPGATPVQPDLVVVLAEDAGIVSAKRIEGIPALVVEILSPSTVDYDLITKRDIYAGAGVPEYWAIRPAERDLILHSDPDPFTRAYRRVEHIPPDSDLVSPTLPFRAPVASFFAGTSSQARPEA
jgi:Uma2 family endonuclease